jgi:hypothetical protein
VSLADSSSVFKDGNLFLWDDEAGGVTALGRQALSSNTVGVANTALGTHALAANSEGSDSTALGWEALANADGYPYNTAVGSRALRYLTAGSNNTAVGYGAMGTRLSGDGNTAVGSEAMNFGGSALFVTAIGAGALLSGGYVADTAVGRGALFASGGWNTAIGERSMTNNLSGNNNVAVGVNSMLSNTEGTQNHALGVGALYSNTTGNRNIALGYYAGSNLGYDPAGYPLGGSDNIHIGSFGVDGDNGVIRIGTPGTHLNTFVSGIYNNPVPGYPVYVDASGRLGSAGAVSSRLSKEDIEDVGDISARLHDLRAVSFRRKGSAEGRTQFGLIAEEVAEVFPDLVVFDDEGRPQAVRYHLLSSLLLNEVQEQRRSNQEQAMEIQRMRARLERLEAAEPRYRRTGLRAPP